MQATIQYINKELAGNYPKSEISGFVRLIFESVCGWSFTEQILKRNEKLSRLEIQKIEAIIKRLKTSEPIQYILGETEFYGLNLKVTPSVLIPRNETIELVRWILDEPNNEKCNVIDVGTGSGCIALALKRQLKKANVLGVDISEEALNVAKENAVFNKLNVNFLRTDILNWEKFNWDTFDLIVSNPPYVREIEKQEMHQNVLKYEPPNALFVSDKNPLVFYIRIADFAQKHLINSGKLFFEINEFFGDEICTMLKHKGFVDIEMKKDINGKNRMVYCRKKK